MTIKRLFNKNALMLYFAFMMVCLGGVLMVMAHLYESSNVDMYVVSLIRIGAGGWFIAAIIMTAWERKIQKSMGNNITKSPT